MDSKCFLTSTDLQMRRAGCQHQLSFLFVSCCFIFCTGTDLSVRDMDIQHGHMCLYNSLHLDMLL